MTDLAAVEAERAENAAALRQVQLDLARAQTDLRYGPIDGRRDAAARERAAAREQHRLLRRTRTLKHLHNRLTQQETQP